MVGLAETPFDLKFRLLDVPVRIHPLFWAVAAVLGSRKIISRWCCSGCCACSCR